VGQQWPNDLQTQFVIAKKQVASEYHDARIVYERVLELSEALLESTPSQLPSNSRQPSIAADLLSSLERAVFTRAGWSRYYTIGLEKVEAALRLQEELTKVSSLVFPLPSWGLSKNVLPSGSSSKGNGDSRYNAQVLGNAETLTQWLNALPDAISKAVEIALKEKNTKITELRDEIHGIRLNSDKFNRERDNAIRERDLANRELSSVKRELDNAIRERDSAVRERYSALGERNEAQINAKKWEENSKKLEKDRDILMRGNKSLEAQLEKSQKEIAQLEVSWAEQQNKNKQELKAQKEKYLSELKAMEIDRQKELATERDNHRHIQIRMEEDLIKERSDKQVEIKRINEAAEATLLEMMDNYGGYLRELEKWQLHAQNAERLRVGFHEVRRNLQITWGDPGGATIVSLLMHHLYTEWTRAGFHNQELRQDVLLQSLRQVGQRLDEVRVPGCRGLLLEIESLQRPSKLAFAASQSEVGQHPDHNLFASLVELLRRLQGPHGVDLAPFVYDADSNGHPYIAA
jgi:hypothetical protein